MVHVYKSQYKVVDIHHVAAHPCVVSISVRYGNQSCGEAYLILTWYNSGNCLIKRRPHDTWRLPRFGDP